jgi:mRNA-degrading endonuclease toxin of MazEF toxin-antitoxin module
MPTRDYKRLKDKGVVSIVVVDEKVTITKKRWNPETGEALSDNVREVDKRELENQKERLEDDMSRLQTELDDVNEVLTDVDAV